MIVVPQIAVAAQSVAFANVDVFDIAQTFVANGASMLQFRAIDTDTATTPDTLEWLERVADSVGVPIQFDGAIENSQALERVARRSFSQVVLSMSAVFDPLMVRWALDLLGDRLLIELCIDGTRLFGAPPAFADLEAIELAHQLRVQGIERLLIRDVTGVDLPVNLLRTLCDDAYSKITFAGLVTSLSDIRELRRINREGMEAVIVGEPLFDGRINLEEATKISK